MPHVTACSRCGRLYEAGSEEQANEPDRKCGTCPKPPRLDLELLRQRVAPFDSWGLDRATARALIAEDKDRRDLAKRALVILEAVPECQLDSDFTFGPPTFAARVLTKLLAEQLIELLREAAS